MNLTGWKIYLLWLAAVSIITFFFYGYDKVQAKRNGGRVPEKYFHWLALFGGFAGGWLGRSVFHHKTRKGVFLFFLIISTLIHLAFSGWFYFN